MEKHRRKIYWVILLALVGISFYWIGINAYRDVMPNRYSTQLNNEIRTVLHNKETLTEQDQEELKKIIDRKGYGIRSLGLIRNMDRSSEILDILHTALFVYPQPFDEKNIGFAAITFGSWSIMTQNTTAYQEASLIKGYSKGLFFLTLAILWFGFMAWTGLRKRKYPWRWLAFYVPPQIVALGVFVFTYIRIH